MKVSVIVPTFNRSSKLRESISYLYNSEFPKKEFEIIIVDDNSTDKTEEIVKNLKKRYNNLEYVKTEKNSGPAHARNLGIKKSKGKYVFFTDDDCLVPNDWLKEYVQFFEENSEIMGVGGLLKPATDNIIAKMELIKDRVLGIRTSEPAIGGEEVPMGFTNNVAYRRWVFNEVGYFDESFKIPGGEDPEFKKRVAEKYKVAFLPLEVVHNHDYNLDYFLGITIKQGLEKRPPEKTYSKIFLLMLNSPILFYNIIKKIIRYRK